MIYKCYHCGCEISGTRLLSKTTKCNCYYDRKSAIDKSKYYHHFHNITKYPKKMEPVRVRQLADDIEGLPEVESTRVMANNRHVEINTTKLNMTSVHSGCVRRLGKFRIIYDTKLCEILILPSKGATRKQIKRRFSNTFKHMFPNTLSMLSDITRFNGNRLLYGSRFFEELNRKQYTLHPHIQTMVVDDNTDKGVINKQLRNSQTSICFGSFDDGGYAGVSPSPAGMLRDLQKRGEHFSIIMLVLEFMQSYSHYSRFIKVTNWGRVRNGKDNGVNQREDS